MILREFILLIGTYLVSVAFSSVSIFSSSFIFSVPFIFFCFLVGIKYGVISFIGAFITLIYKNVFYFLPFSVVLFGLFFVRKVTDNSSFKIKNVLGFYNFFIVFICSLIQSVFFLFSFFCGVVSYWIMICFFELYCSFKSGKRLDSKISSFLLSIIGIALIGFKLSFGYVDLSYVGILIVLYIGVYFGFEVGASYTISLAGLMFLVEGYSEELVLLISSFVVFGFVRNVSRFTLVFVYLLCLYLLVDYFDFEYFSLINCGITGAVILFIPSKVIKYLSSFCCSSEVYMKQLKEREKDNYRKVTKKIVAFQETFSLVNERLGVKNRIKKNDRALLAEEVNVFNNLLVEFSKDLEDNKDLDFNYKIKREFYNYGVDLIDIEFKSNVLKEETVIITVRCSKKEIRTFVVPVVNKVLNNRFEIEFIKFDNVFGYYFLKLRKRVNYKFKYGVSQKSFDGKMCGDSYLVYENEDKYMFAISDGMGNGEVAKEASKLAVNLLKKFMDVGFSIEQTVKSLNSVLKGRYNKDFYSTLDLFVYDKKTDKFYFCKNGAADSYLVNKDKSCVKGNNLPLGIVDNIDVCLQEINVEKDDVVIMTSDGVEDKKFIGIEMIKMNNLQKVCEKIIGDEEVKDDKTVFVIKIC